MSGFLEELKSIDGGAVIAAAEESSPQRVNSVIAAAARGERISTDDFLALCSPAAAAQLEHMAKLARALTIRRFGKTIQLYAPLYISNFCTNSCVYCGFNAHNLVVRRTLSPDQVRAEAAHLSQKHIMQLLLVTGECPCQVSPADMVQTARSLSGLFPSLAIEVYPLDLDDYQELCRAGVDGLTIYQETYDRATYAAVHPAGPKSNFERRLETPERGGEAGFRQIGIGSLLGLADWRFEAYCLVRHATYLMKHFWKSQISVSFPRLRPAAGGYQPPHPVSDKELVQMICAMRLALPDAGLVLSTREPAALRDHVMRLGITRMSAGSKTSPGGYLDEQGSRAEGQFDVSDGRPVEEVVAAIRSMGYEPVWKDWDRGFEGSEPNV